MMRWQIFDGALDVFVSGGLIQPHTTVMSLTAQLGSKFLKLSAERDNAIRRQFEPKLAEKLVGKSPYDRVDDDPINWNAEHGHDTIDRGWVAFASELDWDAGTIKIEWVPDEPELRSWLFPSDEFLDCSEFERADFEAEFRGMAFSADAIEMMLPNHRLETRYVGEAAANAPAGRLGRPMKWDWEGALSYVITQAQTPDGLPTEHGAQARLEEIISDWFMREVGDTPSPSQVRGRASKIMADIRKAKNVEK